MGKVWINFIKIGNPEEVMQKMKEHGILNTDEARNLSKHKYKEQKMSYLGTILGTKEGRNLPLISRCLLESGHRSIAEDLLLSSEKELMEYSVGSG